MTFQRTGAPRDPRALHDAAERGLTAALEHVLKVSNTRVPQDDGDLMRSGKVSVDGLKGAVSYDTEYAVAQHERQDFLHTDGGRAKFLESALADERAEARRLIAEEIREELRRG